MPDERTEPDRGQNHTSAGLDRAGVGPVGKGGDDTHLGAESEGSKTAKTGIRNAVGRGDDGQSGPAGESKSRDGSLHDVQPPSDEEQPASPHRSPERILIGCLALLIVLIVGALALFAWFAASLHPQAGPADHAYAHKTAQAAADHLSRSPLVASTSSPSSEAYTPSDLSAHVGVRLKDATSAQQAAELLASTHEAVFRTKKDNQKVALTVSMSWTLDGTSIAADFNVSRSSSDITTNTTRDLTPVGEARTITRNGTVLSLQVDYGEVTTPPASLTSPSGSRTIKSFSMSGWQVTSASSDAGTFATPPIEQIITAGRQVNPTGQLEIEADPGSMSVTGLATDDDGLTPESAAPVVRAVSDCHAAGLTELNLNTTASFHDTWRSLVCKGRAWAPEHEGKIGQQEAAILQKAAEL